MKIVLKGLVLLVLVVVCFFEEVGAQVKAEFSSDTTKGCAPLIVRFRDLSTGNPIYWRWELGNGTTSFSQNSSTTYFVPGTYTVRLFVRNSNNQADSILKTEYVTVYAPPLVNFKSSEISGCYPLRAQFSDLSTPGNGSIVSWEWDFGDGTTSGVQNPLHIYTELGRYNVTLRIRNSNGCITTLSRENYINVNSGVKADFNLTAPENCRPPALVRFQNLSNGTGTLAYRWSFGDGQTSTATDPAHNFTAGGSYNVKLVVQNNSGCIDSVEKINAVTIGNVKADFNLPSAVCVGTQVNIINNSSPVAVSSRWTLGGGVFSDSLNTSVAYNLPGTYPIKLVSDFGACKDSLIKNLQVLPRPVAAFTANTPGACRGPVTIAFTNRSQNGVAYQWLFGDGTTSNQPSPGHVYSSRGSFDVTLIATGANGCSDTLRMPAFIKILPPALTLKGLPAKGCVPFTYSPAYEIESVEPVATIQWNFGDGATASGLNPSHQYTRAGTYPLTVVVTTRSGCVDTFRYVNAVNVGNPPTPNFTANPQVACALRPIYFSDLSTGDSLTEWEWDFGDGRTSNLQNPAHIYGDTGYFDIKLRVSSNGCVREISIPNFINIKGPVATFLDSSSCGSPLVRRFTDSSIEAKSWFWDFGDGTTSTEREPVHTFPRPGIFTVSLTVKNDTCENTATRQLRIISESPDFTISQTNVCKGAQVNFRTTNLNRANIANLTWIFGDGVSAGLDTNVIHRYTASGNYSVALAFTDLQGCSDTVRKDLVMRVSGPVANFTSNQPAVCVNGTISFTDLSKADAGTSIASWNWNYGDGRSETLTAPPFSHIYTQGGNMLVSLKVTDSNGCSDSLAKPGLIFIARPVAAFNTRDTISCVNALVTFSNLSTGDPVNAVWDFGDQSEQARGLQAAHRYVTEGIFNVSLLITDRYGCRDSISKPAYIAIRNPRSAFSISDTLATCPPLVSTFTNQSVNFNAFEWDFGDGNRSTLNNPVHFYNLAGTFNARLVVTSPGGCRDTSFKQLVVRGPQGTFQYDRIAGCTPVKVKFVATTKDNVSFVWDYNDGTTTSTPDSIIEHEFVIRGKYLPRMILIDPQGCRVPITGPDSISVYGVEAAIANTKNILCDSTVAVFNDASGSNDVITEYSWDFGDGSVSTVRNPLHIFRAPGDYLVKLSVKTANGCVDETDRSLPIKIVANPLISIAGPTSVCVPASVAFIGNAAVPDNDLKWSWELGNGLRRDGISTGNIAYNVPGNFTIRSIAVNTTGCADTALHALTVHALPPVNAGADQIICQGNTVALRGVAGNYSWTPSTTLSCSDCAAPVARPSANISYVLSTTDQFGCKASDTVNISVKQPFSIQASLGDTLCLGKSLALFARGAEVFTWSPALGLDDPRSPTPRAMPQTTTTYMVIGRDTQNCFFDTAYVPVVVFPYPTVNAGPDQTIQVGNSFPLKLAVSSDVNSIRWTPATGLDCAQCGEVIANPKTTTTYSISVLNQGKCETRDDVTINVICKDGNLFMPNTFSPNGDGNNDLFYPRGKGIYGIKSLKIFNRWGELVFQQFNFQANDGSGGSGWNGKYKGRDASQDVYVYMIEVICENNQVLFFKGDVTLVR